MTEGRRNPGESYEDFRKRTGTNVIVMAAGMEVMININDAVLVKLTEAGHRAHRAYYEQFGMGPPKPNPEGYYKFMLWDAMNIFGPHMQVTNQPVFEGDKMILKAT